jgi:hypothetical protein
VRIVEVDLERMLRSLQNQRTVLAMAQVHARFMSHRWRKASFDELAHQANCFFAAHVRLGSIAAAIPAFHRIAAPPIAAVVVTAMRKPI